MRSGQALTKQEVKRSGNDPALLSSESQTQVLGPFTVDPVHAEVRASLRVTISENYHSATVECSVMIPTQANAEAAQAGYEWAHDFCARNINEKIKKVRSALRSVAGGSAK